VGGGGGGHTPNPPIPNPQSPIPNLFFLKINLKVIYKRKK